MLDASGFRCAARIIYDACGEAYIRYQRRIMFVPEWMERASRRHRPTHDLNRILYLEKHMQEVVDAAITRDYYSMLDLQYIPRPTSFLRFRACEDDMDRSNLIASVLGLPHYYPWPWDTECYVIQNLETTSPAQALRAFWRNKYAVLDWNYTVMWHALGVDLNLNPDAVDQEFKDICSSSPIADPVIDMALEKGYIPYGDE